MPVNRLATAAISAVKIIGSSIRKSAKNERRNCATKNYLSSPTAHILENARSAFCRCRLIEINLHFLHAAVNWFVMAVAVPITYNTEAILVHSAENRW
mgnify:CR=1 FL=1